MYIREIVAILVTVLAVGTSELCYGQSLKKDLIQIKKGLRKGQNLKEDLIQIERLRNGPKTPLDEVDRRGNDLLNQYPNPKDRGQIYYQLAHIHAQSGLLHPERVIGYAYEALRCPLEPSQQMRLHTYWGDALTVKDRKKPFTESRREAAAIYLKGLRRLVDLNLNLPEKPPEHELMTFFNGSDDEENNRKNQEQLARSRQIDFQRDMINHRNVQQKQIVSLYGRRPTATEELREMATNILGEGKALDRLMSAVNDKVAKLPPEKKPTMTPIEAAVPASWPTYLSLSIALGIGAIIAVVLLLLSRWGRARRATGSKTAQ